MVENAPGALPAFFQPMMATLADGPFDSPNHLFEVKWDGVRVLAFCDHGSTRLYSRAGRPVEHQYPEFRDLHKRLAVRNAVLDAEIIAVDSAGRPSFERLQQRINLSRPSEIKRAVDKVALDLVVFDLVYADGAWQKELPLQQRLELMDQCLRYGDRVLRSQAIATHGVQLFQAVRTTGLEGIVAKKIDSRYLPGRRTRDWLKIKVVQQADCVIGGWSLGMGWRQRSLGAILVGAYDEGALRYLGSVGTGFTEKTVAGLRELLGKMESSASPFTGKVPVKNARWVAPRLVAEVEYRELTGAKRLRAPAFKRLRDDKLPEDCLLSDLQPVSGQAG